MMWVGHHWLAGVIARVMGVEVGREGSVGVAHGGEGPELPESS